MKTCSKKVHAPAGLHLRGQWLFKLPDPFRQIAYLPIDAVTLAENLGMTYRAALKVCKGEKALPVPAVRFLQVLHFGLIPDPDFMRGRWRIRHGELYSQHFPGHSFTPGELSELAALLPEYRRIMAEVHEARAKLAAAEGLADRYERLRLKYRETVRELRAARAELALQEGPDLSNVIRFPGLK